MRWIRLAEKFTKARPQEALKLLGSFINKLIPKSEEILDINYPNRTILIVIKDGEDPHITLRLAKYEVIIGVDELLSISSMNHLQGWFHAQLATTHKDLSIEDAATISALMIQKLQEEQYIQDATSPV